MALPVTATSSASTSGSGPQLEVQSNGFGANITNMSFANGVDEKDFQFLKQAVKDHGFAVVRQTNLTDETHIELSKRFGELDDVTPYNKAGRVHRLKYNELFDVGNIAHDGSLLDPTSPHAQSNKGNALFHTDSSFNPRRAGLSLLLAHELPPAGTGGNTEFADMRAAYRDLDDDFKALLHQRDFVARHSLLHSKKLAAPDFYEGIEPTEYFMSRHKLLQTHEHSGRGTIYLAKHIHSLEGVSAEESQELLDRLFAHATQSKYVVNVEWHNVGDMIVWDNTCTMHRATGGEFIAKYRRDMRRTTVHDDSSLAWGLNERSNERMGLP